MADLNTEISNLAIFINYIVIYIISVSSVGRPLLLGSSFVHERVHLMTGKNQPFEIFLLSIIPTLYLPI